MKAVLVGVELPVDRWRPARNLAFARGKAASRTAATRSTEGHGRQLPPGTLSVTGVTATAAAPSLLRRATGGTVGSQEGRVAVRGSSTDALELARATLRALKPGSVTAVGSGL